MVCGRVTDHVEVALEEAWRPAHFAEANGL